MRGHGAEAQRTLRLGFEAEPGNPEWGYVLANFLLQEGQPDEALRIVNAALGHDPRNGALLDLRDRIIAARRNQSADG
jgi:predicted Zn-dependent protease